MKTLLLLASYVAFGVINIKANEIMTERCGDIVAIVPSYNATPNTSGTRLPVRASRGSWMPWTQPFRVAIIQR